MSSGAPVGSNVQLVVVFGRPGAGKTTIADAVIEKVGSELALGLDLDVCIPQWMKDNFSKGIYPTLKQRHEFMAEACHYVQDKIDQTTAKVVLVSFSFVNIDLRNGFREAFPHAKWALVDTTEQEAELRIQQRQGHFYTGAPSSEKEKPVEMETKSGENNDKDNSEWLFAPVTFQHTILPGAASIENNAQTIIEILEL